jgi:hypothetical protein
VLEYIAAAFAATPILSQLVASRTADTLTLTNSVSIEVRSASFRLRGPTYLAVICDEAAFWHSDESALILMMRYSTRYGLCALGDVAPAFI